MQNKDFQFHNNNRHPNGHYWIWVAHYLPQGGNMYMVGLAAVCWALWRTTNSVCFKEKRVKSPTDIVCMMCSFLIYWAGLLKSGLQQQVVQSVEVVKDIALHLHRAEPQIRDNEDRQIIPFVG